MKTQKSNFKSNPPPTKPSKGWHLLLANAGIVIIAIVLSLALIYGLYSYKAYKIPSGSMEPTLLIGDHFISLRYYPNQQPDRGDIAIFPFPNDRKKDYVKRIVGLPGEKLEIRQQQVYINDKVLNEPYAMHTQPSTQKLSPRDDLAPTKIPDGQVFVLGDNRENSHDSRHFGPVAIKGIEREVKIIYWSWNSEEQSVRWERIGKTPE